MCQGRYFQRLLERKTTLNVGGIMLWTEDTGRRKEGEEASRTLPNYLSDSRLAMMCAACSIMPLPS